MSTLLLRNGRVIDPSQTIDQKADLWLKDGRIKYQETILDGFERAPEGLIGLFEGRNAGKMLIRVAD